MKPRLIYRFRDYLKERYPFDVRKLSLHSGLGCPHRENQTGEGGCIYCYEPAFSLMDQSPPAIEDQIRDTLAYGRGKGFEGKFLAYFQTGTNTYGPIEVLEKQWRTIEAFPDDIMGLAVGTRPDCLSDDALALLSDLGRSRMVWLELGLQSGHDRTLRWMNRGHDTACFRDAVLQVRKYPNILVCAHVILGLPGESPEEMRTTIDLVNDLGLDGIKLHHLQVVRHTKLAALYEAEPFPVLTLNAYIDLLKDLIPRISPDMIIHRLLGDVKLELLIAPRWGVKKVKVIQMIEKALKEADLWQGKFYRT